MYIRIARPPLKGKRPLFGMGCSGCGSQPALLARRLGRRLGQDDGGDDYGGYQFATPGAPGTIQAGGPTYEPGTGPTTPPDILPTGIPGSAGAPGSLTPTQLQNIGTGGLNLNPPTTVSTLLAAAALPNAPPIVVQAAQQYTAQHPVQATLSQTVLGVPVMYIALGLGVLLLIPLLSRRKR